MQTQAKAVKIHENQNTQQQSFYHDLQRFVV